MDASCTIRTGDVRDSAALAEVMFEAVRRGPSKYTSAQLAAWVPEIRSGPEWSKRLMSQAIWVAEQDQVVVGFMSLAENGYIDLAFIRPSHQGTGVFRGLYERMEQSARARGVKRLWVHASLMAQPAFSAMGFSAIEEQAIEVRGEVLRRFEMEKSLESA